MENKKIIGLSFDDKKIKVCRADARTVVSVVSNFRGDKLGKFLNDLGFCFPPDVVNNTLKRYGYKYDFKSNCWWTKTTGVIVLDPRDEDDEQKAYNIALTKAKVKAYKRARNCFSTLKKIFADTMILFDDAEIEMTQYLDDETEAYERVIVTGYCNPDKK